MQELKKIILKLIIFVFALIILNFFYTQFLHEAELEKHSNIFLSLQQLQTNCKIIYFGESSNFNYNPKDKQKRRISDFTADYYPEIILQHIDNSAYHAGNFKILAKNLPSESQIETVIVTMNLRSFNADWRYSNLETALQKSMVLIDPRFPPLINRFRLSLKDYEIKTDEERYQQVLEAWEDERLVFPYPFKYENVTDWNQAMANGTYLNEDGSWNIPKISLACHYIKSYAFQIDSLNNPRIKDFDELVNYSKKQGWNLVFNLMAENVQKAQELVGDELVWLIRQNRTFLVQRYQKNNVVVVDNLEIVNDNLYTDRNWTTEHYAEKGRKLIAKNLADSLRIFYPEGYVER